MLSGENSHTAYHIFDVMQGAVDANDNALGNNRLRNHLDIGFDVVIVNSFFCSEAGYYLAQRGDAALVLYLSGQVSISNLDWAVGQPHNTAYLPFPMLDFQPPFTFPQRVINTIGTYLYHMFRQGLMYTMIKFLTHYVHIHFSGILL